MEERKVFDYLHTELSVLAGRFLPRMDLWEEFDAFDCFSVYPTRDTARRFLNERAAQLFPEISEKKLRRLTKRFERWDPNADTPEEIFARICSGFWKKS